MEKSGLEIGASAGKYEYIASALGRLALDFSLQ